MRRGAGTMRFLSVIVMAVALDSAGAQQRETSLQIPSGGAMLSATLYHGDGTAPNPTIAWFHGFPGLPQPTQGTIARLRDSGLHVLYVHYRGSWNAPGTFSAAHALEDASAVLEYLRTPQVATEHRIDPARVIPFGDSFGSWVALTTAAADSRAPCVAGAVVTNLGQLGTAFASDTTLRAAFAGVFAAVASDTALGYRFDRGPDRLMDEIIAGRARHDLVSLADALRDRPVLLIGADRDDVAPPTEHLAPLARALATAGATQVTQRIFPGGHDLPDASYADLLASWILGHCAG